MRLHLASASPRRADILRSLGLSFTAEGVDIDESPLPGEAPHDFVLRVSIAKAEAVPMLSNQAIIGSDTAVVVGTAILGKPRDADHAATMLQLLSGRSHRVLTGVAVRSASATHSAVSSTEVMFREIDQDEITRYWQSGEPRDKAGGYAIQGLGGAFVRSISGSYSGVVGLPVFETVQLLEKAGINCF